MTRYENFKLFANMLVGSLLCTSLSVLGIYQMIYQQNISDGLLNVTVGWLGMDIVWIIEKQRIELP